MLFANNPDAVLQLHHAERDRVMAVAHRRHPMHRYSGTVESRAHHIARWWSVVTYHYASHARRALRHAGHALAHPIPVRAR